jgi:tetratricopeptide (TPR) repeat protein
MGVVLGMQGKLVEAADHFYQALRINPDYAGAHYNLGKVQAEQGRFEEAYGHFSQAVKLRPDYTNARISLQKLKHIVGKSSR